jgi:hypothetical protein
MSEVIRLTDHRSDPSVILAHAGPSLSGHMGRLQEARWSPAEKAYLVHRDALDGLRALARYAGASIVDDRRTEPAPHTAGVECANCGQPGQRYHPPNRCPACGEPWRSVDYPDHHGDPMHTRQCPACRATQRGAFPYCSACGQPMPPREPPGRPVLPQREHLDDPMPFGQALAETFPGSPEQP